jgi:hypothetical protein
MRQRLVAKTAKRYAYTIDHELEAADLIQKVVLATVKDAEQFRKHLVTRRKSKSTTGVGSESDQWTEENLFTVVDTKRLQALAATLETTSRLKRMLLDIIDIPTDQKMELDKQKFELEKLKSEQGDKETVINIISHIPRPPKEEQDESESESEQS